MSQKGTFTSPQLELGLSLMQAPHRGVANQSPAFRWALQASSVVPHLAGLAS
jgi:hypothetical protein